MTSERLSQEFLTLGRQLLHAYEERTKVLAKGFPESKPEEEEHLTATRLVPTRWWRVLDSSDASIWCETSDEREAVHAMGQITSPLLQRLWNTETKSMWKDVT